MEVGIAAAGKQKLGCRRTPHCLPDAPQWATSNHRAGEWGLGWPQAGFAGLAATGFWVSFTSRMAIEYWLPGMRLLHHGIGIHRHVYELVQASRGWQAWSALYMS